MASMRVWAALLAILTGLCCGPAFAQQGGGAGAPGAPNATEMTSRPDVTPDQRIFRDNAYNRQLEHGAHPSKAQMISDSAGLLESVRVPCTVSDAVLVAQGPADIGGRTIDTKTYEASCDSGLGYFVVSADITDAFSCFAADATRAKDIAAGRTPSAGCSLPANKDTKTMASAILGRLGINCNPSGVKWIGLSAKAKTEYTEAACTDGKGYVILSAAPGSGAAPTALACPEAARRGLLCTMSPNGQPTYNIATFRDALTARHIACAATDDNIRLIGQETVSRRHVVEFRCAEYPNGLVAFIPLENKSKPFESMDCARAVQRHAVCTLR